MNDEETTHTRQLAVDPTANVVALTEAANKRQDDLRMASEKFFEAEIRHTRELAVLRSEHSKELDVMESSRLNAIRQVDVLAVNTAAERSQAAIQALANTTATNAENLRNALTATAATIATQLNNTVTAITERISALEKSSYEGKGKERYSDPIFTELVQEMKSLRKSRDFSAGGDSNKTAVWATILALLGLAVAIWLKK